MLSTSPDATLSGPVTGIASVPSIAKMLRLAAIPSWKHSAAEGVDAESTPATDDRLGAAFPQNSSVGMQSSQMPAEVEDALRVIQHNLEKLQQILGHQLPPAPERTSATEITQTGKPGPEASLEHVTYEEGGVVEPMDARVRAPSTRPDLEQGSNAHEGGPLSPSVTHRLPSSEIHRAEHPGFVHKFLLYHAMFSLCFSGAMAALVAALAGAFGEDTDNRSITAIVTIGILSACVAIRNEVVLNVLYLGVVHSLPHALPRIVRVAAARFLYNVGGIHSGCGAAAAVWLMYYIALIIADGNVQVVVLATAVILLLLMTTIIALALPAVRQQHHNLFELSHRFLGWSAVLVLWLHVMAVYDVHMWAHPVFYLTIAITVLVFLPWMFVRNVGVQCHVPYKNAVIISGIPGAPLAGTFGRISTAPLGEWHSFATITTGGRTHITRQKTHCMAIAAAGDWTKNLIAKPPSRIWVRQIRTPGFMYTTRMFSRIVCMATGAGIAPVLPLVVQQSTDIFVLWVAREPEKFYGKQVFQWVTDNGKCWIHDTATAGHPNSVELALRAVKKHNAEALFIVSNPKLTYQVVRGCSEVGVPAFGAIWDS